MSDAFCGAGLAAMFAWALALKSHCRPRVNGIVDRDKQVLHFNEQLLLRDRASTDNGTEPDVVMACAGDIPTQESLAAVQILRERFRT